MTRFHRMLASTTLALALFGFGSQFAQAQSSYSSSTSWSSSSGYSSSWSSGPNGFQSSRSGYNANSFQRSQTYSNPYATYGRNFSANNYRDFSVDRGYINGNSYLNRTGNQFSNRQLDTFMRYR
jgi:hypothetical protein